VVIAYFKVPSYHFLGGTGENREKQVGESESWPTIKLGTSKYKSESILFEKTCSVFLCSFGMEIPNNYLKLSFLIILSGTEHVIALSLLETLLQICTRASSLGIFLFPLSFIPRLSFITINKKVSNNLIR
jgi:hypothetical protein